MILFLILLGIVLLTVLLYRGHGYWAWLAAAASFLAAAAIAGDGPGIVVKFFALLVLAAALIFGLPPLRRRLISARLMEAMARILPRIGDTERIALEAGTVWWDGELFSGNPDWSQLLEFQVKPLSQSEREFLDGPVEELCHMLDEWQITQRRDLPPDIWDYLKRHRFFGMIIPEEYGGLGFSALAHSAVVTKIASRSNTAAVTVMVPNSLGPAELLLHYGTDEQKQYYLPRLAIGEEIPCFGLTGPEAGSDAASTQSTGVVERGTYQGREVLGIRLNWRKRYITLAPVATVIGLAFRLYDPYQLLGEETDLGITCALIPRNLEGIEIGDRHDTGVPFQNGPIFGRDVFVPIDFIIGGAEQAGNGWRMLMESLAAGRSISLPSMSVGISETAARLAGAYATVREQFNMPIGRFEGIEEPLARIGGYSYFMNAARTLTCGAVDAGQKPAVLSAIVKAYLTEGMRRVVLDAMDIRAGAAICRGPRNVLASFYQAAPIAITVEGANILTRSLIIFGQGAIRCHPFVYDEMQAIADNDLARFDRALFGHLNFAVRNAVRAELLAWTGSRIASTPVEGEQSDYFRHLSRLSAAFALVSDVAMGTLGGTLKRREKISGRLADALAWLYVASATLKRFHDDGRPEEDMPLVRWGCEHAIYNVQEAIRGVIDNFPNRTMQWLLRATIFPLGARFRPPNDRLGAAVARGMLDDRQARLHLTRDIFVPPENELGLGRLEVALDQAVSAFAVQIKLRDAVRFGAIATPVGNGLADEALAAGIITQDEHDCLDRADEIRDEVIQVDAFDPTAFRDQHG